jgi:hypothetical protein
MRNLFIIIVLALLGFAGWVFSSYGTITPCGIVEQEFRDDVGVEAAPGETWTDEDFQKAEETVDEAVRIAVSNYTQMECVDKVMAFWFLDDPYGEESDAVDTD